VDPIVILKAPTIPVTQSSKEAGYLVEMLMMGGTYSVYLRLV